MSEVLLVDEVLFRSRHRLVHLERVAYWRGMVSRADLVKTFDLSGVQASADLQKYLEINPGALAYDMSRKRYLWVDGARPRLHVPDFERAVAEYLVDDGPASLLGLGGVLRLSYPRREVAEDIRLAVFRAVVTGRELRVRYGSLHAGAVGERTLLPTGFGHDGFRWHLRAYCLERRDYRDFVLGRIREIVATGEAPKKPRALPPDTEWLETVEVRMRVNPKLPAEVREILAEDFALDGEGVLCWPVRRALEHYARHHLESLAHPVEGPGRRMKAWFVPC